MESNEQFASMNDRSDKQQMSPDQYGKVAVLMGGDSGEREISLKSGNAVLTALCSAGVDAHKFDPAEQPLTDLIGQSYSRAFIALHGRGGEDGQIQGALQMLKIPYTGSGVLASALGMDKSRTKRIWQTHMLPTPEFMIVDATTPAERIVQTLGLPVFVKPAHEGSSLGINKVTTIQALPDAIEQALALDPLVLAETAVNGSEYTVPILDGETLPMIRLQTPREFYDYVAKYEEDTTEYICPCGLPAEIEKQIGNIALQAFTAIDATGWGRVDLMIDDDAGPLLIEVNTVPGMTDHSLVPMAARQAGISFEQLVIRILQGSLVYER